MPPLLPLMTHGLVYGLILTALLVAITVVSGRLNPAIFAGDYPPDIRAKFGPPDARTQRQTRWLLVILLAVILSVLGAMAAAMPAAGLAPTFVDVLIAAFMAMFTFNLIDLLVLDWLIFVTWRPSFIVLPGTEGMAGYGDYGFHFVGFLKGLGLCVVMALVTALLVLGVSALIH